MAEFIFVITEFHTTNSDDFAHLVSGSQVLWFSPLTYFTHTLTSCPQAVCAKQRFEVCQSSTAICLFLATSLPIFYREHCFTYCYLNE